MSRITITIDTPDTLDTIDFVFEVDDALNMGFKHEFAMWTIEPKRGRWIVGNKTSVFDLAGVETWAVRMTCSECSFSLNFVEGHTAQYRFCPQCGARMDAEDEPKLCASCPYNPVEAMIRNGGEDVCPDAFKPVATHCNYNCQKRGAENDETY